VSFIDFLYFDVEWTAHGLVLRHKQCQTVCSSHHGKKCNLATFLRNAWEHECPLAEPVAPPGDAKEVQPSVESDPADTQVVARASARRGGPYPWRGRTGSL
jgi:hypothetical protein